MNEFIAKSNFVVMSTGEAPQPIGLLDLPDDLLGAILSPESIGRVGCT